MPAIAGILETSLYVEDVAKSVEFYRDIFGFAVLLNTNRIATLRVREGQVLLLFKRGGSTEPLVTPGGTLPPNDGSGQSHVAFSIAAFDLEPWEEWLAKREIAIESKVRSDLGGLSLYFRDPDGHLLELATPGIWSAFW